MTVAPAMRTLPISPYGLIGDYFRDSVLVAQNVRITGHFGSDRYLSGLYMKDMRGIYTHVEGFQVLAGYAYKGEPIATDGALTINPAALWDSLSGALYADEIANAIMLCPHAYSFETV